MRLRRYDVYMKARTSADDEQFDLIGVVSQHFTLRGAQRSHEFFSEFVAAAHAESLIGYVILKHDYR